MLQHSKEVAILAGHHGGGDGAGRADGQAHGALLHDIGKALTHEHEGTHVQLGVELCEEIQRAATRSLNAIAAHHDEEPHR